MTKELKLASVTELKLKSKKCGGEALAFLQSKTKDMTEKSDELSALWADRMVAKDTIATAEEFEKMKDNIESKHDTLSADYALYKKNVLSEFTNI